MVYYFLIIFTVIWGVLCKVYSTRRLITKKTSIKLFLIPVFTLAFLIMGFRGIRVGTDTISYYRIFNSFHVLSFKEAKTEDIEYLWALLCWLVNQFVNSFVVFQLLISGLFCFLTARFIYSMCYLLKKDYTLVMTVVIFTMIYIHSFNIIRQLLAVMFVVTSWDFYRLKKYALSIIFFCAGILIHTSAIVGVILLALWKLRSWRFYIPFCLSMVVLCYIFFNVITDYLINLHFYVKYANNSFNKYLEANFSKIVWLIIAIFSFYILIRKKHFSSFDIFAAICCIIYVLTNLLGSKINYFERMGFYFLPFVAVLYPIIGNSIRSKSIKIVYYSGLITMYSIWFILSSRSEQYIYSLSI